MFHNLTKRPSAIQLAAVNDALDSMDVGFNWEKKVYPTGPGGNDGGSPGNLLLSIYDNCRTRRLQ